MFNLILMMSVSLSFSVDRISEQNFDLKKTKRIYMTAGRASVLDFPCDIHTTVSGLHDDIKWEIGPEKSNHLVLWLSDETSEPTNLIVRCEERVFVFDVLPSESNHQDYVKINKAFKYSSNTRKSLIDSSSLKTRSDRRHKIRRELISSSDSKDKVQ